MARCGVSLSRPGGSGVGGVRDCESVQRDDANSEQLGAVEHVWRYAWDDDLGTVPPRPVTDAAIRTGRRAPEERLVVHDVQPYFPSLADDIDTGVALDDFGDESLSVWEDLRFGRLPCETVREAVDGDPDIEGLLRQLGYR